jgi:hypothetical protein
MHSQNTAWRIRRVGKPVVQIVGIRLLRELN